MSKNKNIYFIPDLLRPPIFSIKGAKGNAINIKDILKWQIETATKKKLEPFLPKEVKEGAQFSSVEFYRTLGCDFNESKEIWQQAFHADPTKESVQYIKNYFPKDFIIGYEIPESILKICDILKVSYINIRISPIKYMQDLMFAFSTNNEKIYNKISKWRTTENQFFMEAHNIQAFNRKPEVEENSKDLLILGQLWNDASLIKNGKFLSFQDYQEKLIKIIKNYDNVYYKKHPYSDASSKEEKFINTLSKNIKNTNKNVYKLMFDENIKTIVAISSGVAQEAKYFGKDAIVLHKPLCELVLKNETFSKKYIPVYRDPLDANFWADILSPVYKTNKISDVKLLSHPNLIRVAHGSSWDYENMAYFNSKFYTRIFINFMELTKKNRIKNIKIKLLVFVVKILKKIIPENMYNNIKKFLNYSIS